jgi:sugar lactone lactonase YvrE
MQFDFMHMDEHQMPCYQARYENGRIEVKLMQGLPLVDSTNGIAFSPCGKYMYHSDSRTGYLAVYDYESDEAKCQNGRQVSIALTDQEQKRPICIGGSCIDSNGDVWQAHYFTPIIRCYKGFQPGTEFPQLVKQFKTS